MQVCTCARLRLEREGPQGEGRRHYGLAAGAAVLVDEGAGDEEVRIARRKRMNGERVGASDSHRLPRGRSSRRRSARSRSPPPGRGAAPRSCRTRRA
eukprot:scaffold92580_cov65-Phaeocystis_antarctica.AAC.1